MTNPMMVGVLFSGVWLLLAVPAGVFLILSYLKTRLSGFIWLCVSVVVWPLVERLLTLAVNMSVPSFAASSGLPASSIMSGLMVFSLLEAGAGGVLLVASCFILYRQIMRARTIERKNEEQWSQGNGQTPAADSGGTDK